MGGPSPPPGRLSVEAAGPDTWLESLLVLALQHAVAGDFKRQLLSRLRIAGELPRWRPAGREAACPSTRRAGLEQM